MRHQSLVRAIVSALALAAAATACQGRPAAVTAAVPVVVPALSPAALPVLEATSLYIRNHSAFDVAVYAVPNAGADAKAVWLTSVPGNGTRSVAIRWSDLQASGGLVLRTRISGSSRTWTSEPLIVDDGIVAVLDLTNGASLTTAGSVLRGVTVQAFEAAMR